MGTESATTVTVSCDGSHVGLLYPLVCPSTYGETALARVLDSIVRDPEIHRVSRY